MSDKKQPPFQPMEPKKVRELFEAHGHTITAWAREHGYPRSIVRDVLLGKAKGTRGKAHQIAVHLGLKPRQRKKPGFFNLKKAA